MITRGLTPWSISDCGSLIDPPSKPRGAAESLAIAINFQRTDLKSSIKDQKSTIPLTL
jgi:hypothetical protein